MQDPEMIEKTQCPFGVPVGKTLQLDEIELNRTE